MSDSLPQFDLLTGVILRREAHALFGVVPEGMTRLLEAGLCELSFDERQAFTEAVTRAQAVLRDHCMKAVFASGRARYLAPDNVADLVNYKQHKIMLKKESVR